MHRLLIASLITAVAVFAACFDSPDPLYCDEDTPCTDPERPFCDLTGQYPASDGQGRTCIPDPGIVEGECEASAECPAEAPICAEEMCELCTADAECESRDPATPYCADSGVCVSCQSADDCSAEAPVCGESGTCRGCEAHSECASGVCEVDSGTCVGASALIHVDPATGADGTDCGSAGTPCATITGALEQVEAERNWVVLAAGTYGESVTIDGLEVNLLGPVEAVIQPAGGAVGVSVQGASVATLEGVSVKSAISGAAGVMCFAGAGPSPTLHLRGVHIAENNGPGIDADDCTLTVEQSTLSGNAGGGISASGGTITVEQSTLSGNAGGGISASGGTITVEQSTLSRNAGGGLSIQNAGFRVVNNFIVGNGLAGDSGTLMGGVRIQNDTAKEPQELNFNTVANSQSDPMADASGVQCAVSGEMTASSNLVYSDADAPSVKSTNCTWAHSLIKGGAPGTGNVDADPLFVDPREEDYHLQPGSPAVDAADPAATLDVDVDGDARPQGAGHDMGADEVVE